MWCIVHTSKSGRAKLAFNRTMIITASAFIITGVLFFTTFLTSFILYKTASINAPIQNIESFSRFSLPMSQLQYIIYDFLYSFCAVLTLTAIVWMAFVFIRHRNIAVTVIAVFMGVEMFLYQKIHPQSVYGIFKQINLIRLLKVNDIIHFLRREMLDFTAFPVFFVSNLLLVQRKKYYFNRAMVSRNCSIVL